MLVKSRQNQIKKKIDYLKGRKKAFLVFVLSGEGNEILTLDIRESQGCFDTLENALICVREWCNICEVEDQNAEIVEPTVVDVTHNGEVDVRWKIIDMKDMGRYIVEEIEYQFSS